RFGSAAYAAFMALGKVDNGAILKIALEHLPEARDILNNASVPGETAYGRLIAYVFEVKPTEDQRKGRARIGRLIAEWWKPRLDDVRFEASESGLKAHMEE
ncbi:MAG: hypothetical protein ACOCYE_14415, partial [Pseudomonadota bacterium]